ncbi:MAG: right-handed parallel beta-helix repeat-containing protein [Phaeodactylibacter sp.]|nr:right-handed parallel beta-helix repeat-containing protein [Phaeodactylibacter sp.]
MKKVHQRVWQRCGKPVAAFLKAYTHTSAWRSLWRSKVYFLPQLGIKPKVFFLSRPSIRSISFTFLSIVMVFLQSGFSQGQAAGLCEEGEYHFTGVPEPTLCEQYGNLLPDLEVGAGTPITRSSQIGSSFTGNVYIMGDFQVDEPFKFIDCIVKIEPGATVFILPPVQPFVSNILTIDNSKLFACSDMWKGIVLSSNTSISTLNETEIEDAFAAIQANNAQFSSLLIEETVFDRNDIGILLSQDTALISPATMINFAGNLFSCTAPLNGTADQVSFAGIKTENVPFTVNPVAEAFNNKFDGLQNGIVSEGGATMISGRFFRFERIKKDGIYIEEGSLNLVNSRFRNCEEKGINIGLAHRVTVRQGNFWVGREIPESPDYRTGIYIDGFGLNSRVDLNVVFTGYLEETENRVRGIHLKGGNLGSGTLITIDNSFFGIRAKSSDGIFLDGAFPGSSKIHIFENVFATGNPDTTGVSTGIDIHGYNSNLSISGNYFTGNGYYNTAIFARGSSGVNNHISGNYIEGSEHIVTSGDYFGVGFSLAYFQNTKVCSNVNFFGSNIAFVVVATSPGIDFEGNLIYATAVGLELFGAPIIGPQFHQGNKWRPVVVQRPTGPVTYRAAFHARCKNCDAQQAALNKFTVHTPQSVWNSNTVSYDFFSDYHPERIEPDLTNEFFEYDPAGTPSAGCIPFSSEPEMSELDKIVADGQFQAPTENPSMGWLVNRYLYRKLKDNPDLVEAYPSFPSFLNTHQNTSVGQFYEASHKIEEAIEAEEQLDLKSQEVLEKLIWVTDSLMIVDSLLQVAEDENELEALIQSKFGLTD